MYIFGILCKTSMQNTMYSRVHKIDKSVDPERNDTTHFKNSKIYQILFIFI
jgi:hypothetical protein